jgi:hypothetical protein
MMVEYETRLGSKMQISFDQTYSEFRFDFFVFDTLIRIIPI